MNFICQTESLENIKLLADHKQHGVLIVGNPGSGKTYLARRYAKLLGISDFYIINPVIADLKIMIDSCVESQTNVVICIENLDSGVIQASYPLLKLIEDCPSYIYVVVTCNNLYAVPDTILSRCALVTINPPTKSDIDQYAKSKDLSAYELLHEKKIWSYIKWLSEADVVLKFTPEHLKYFNDLEKIPASKDTVANISWRLQHYEDKTETPINLVIRYLMQFLSTGHQRACLECLNDLAENRISKNAIISKLAFELKYVK